MKLAAHEFEKKVRSNLKTAGELREACDLFGQVAYGIEHSRMKDIQGSDGCGVLAYATAVGQTLVMLGLGNEDFIIVKRDAAVELLQGLALCCLYRSK